ncbi:CmcI family methyltransferase [candidate division CSSED10-310 bacterium]|uniref:CmcI family methyltransferase n=1 Tax=candidate division CSSED10-310 bacterium TaxID=2855610 RepID=A0ABV6YXY8_UNCC1
MFRIFNESRMIIVTLLLVSGLIFVQVAECTEEKKELDPKEVVRAFNQMHYNYKTYMHTTWLGISARQNPCDMWTMQEIITQVKPDFIIETGTLFGGSSLFFAMLLEKLNKKGKVITVDILPRIEEASKWDVFKERVIVITGDSVSAEVINKIAKLVKGHTALVTLDSMHSKDHVLKELKLYSKFVTVNSYLIVQDTNLNGHPVFPDHGPGPMEAVLEFMKNNEDFQIDRIRERHLLTYFPKGYLKRVR